MMTQNRARSRQNPRRAEIQPDSVFPFFEPLPPPPYPSLGFHSIPSPPQGQLNIYPEFSRCQALGYRGGLDREPPQATAILWDMPKVTGGVKLDTWVGAT